MRNGPPLAEVLTEWQMARARRVIAAELEAAAAHQTEYVKRITYLQIAARLRGDSHG
jgi:hypothetical protein